jgi:hypothetical protein
VPDAVPSVRSESGQWRDGQKVGVWRFRDEAGRVIGQVDYGSGTGLEVPRLPAWSDERRADWEVLGRALLERGEIPEGLVTLARASAALRSPRPLVEALAGHARPLGREASLALVRSTAPTLAALAGALVHGASVPDTLGRLAGILRARGQLVAALDLVNAALLFAPGDAAWLEARARVLLGLGLPHQARRDALELAAARPQVSADLLALAAALFPTFDFWPDRERPATSYADLPAAPVKSLQGVRIVAQKYATRLEVLRRRLLELVRPEVDYLWPDVGALLPEGPLELDQGEVEVPADQPGGEAVLHPFDERLPVAHLGVPGVMVLARAQWAALTWLSWSAGASRLELVSALRPPADFGQAVGMASQRRWRARDQRLGGHTTGGLPGFRFEGLELATAPAEVALVAEQQYAEVEAMFSWLSRTDVTNPWQDNVKGP